MPNNASKPITKSSLKTAAVRDYISAISALQKAGTPRAISLASNSNFNFPSAEA